MPKLIILGFIVLVWSSCTSKHQTKSNSLRNVRSFDQTSKFTARSLIGYWESRDDGLITHITEVSEYSTGTGSFKDINGKLIAAGKFRDIHFIGNGKWKCIMYRHSPSLIYPSDPSSIFWEDAVIEMLDINTIRVENTLFGRI